MLVRLTKPTNNCHQNFPKTEVNQQECDLVNLLKACSIAASNRIARDLISASAISVNDQVINNLEQIIYAKDGIDQSIQS